MSPSPPKHRKLITQARDKSMRPSTSGWSKLTSRKYVCCQMFSPSAVRHVTYNIDVQYIDVQYSGSPQRETWSKSSSLAARHCSLAFRKIRVYGPSG